MNRREFLALGVLTPVMLKSGLVWAKAAYEPVTNVVEASFSDDPNSPKGTLWQIPRQSQTQMMGYVYRADNGQTIVIDGGNAAEGVYLKDLIKRECDGKVDAWFLTHAHSDHFGALVDILTRFPDELKIDAFYYNFPEQSWLSEYEKGNRGAIFRKAIEPYQAKAYTPKIDEVFRFGSTTFKCLNDFDLSITQNAVNNSSICFRMDVGGKSILFLGDLGKEAGARLLKTQSKDVLDCDFCQMAHHGQQGVDKSFYEVAAPSVCLWPTPDWLWNNDKGDGPNSGPWKTLETRAWVEELGIKRHFISKDGLTKLTF